MQAGTTSNATHVRLTTAKILNAIHEFNEGKFFGEGLPRTRISKSPCPGFRFPAFSDPLQLNFKDLLKSSKVSRAVMGYQRHVFQTHSTEFRVIQAGFNSNDVSGFEDA